MTETVLDEDHGGKDKDLALPLVVDIKKTSQIDQKKMNVGNVLKAEAPAKTGADGVSVKDKLMRAFGMRKEVSPAKNANKLSLFSDSGEAEKNYSQTEVPESKNAHIGLHLHEKPGDDMDGMHMRREMKMKAATLDNDRLTQRLTELETHVKEIHSAFDNFVLHSDQFLNYEQFLDVQNEVKEKIRLLDKLEKSLEESKNMILKDAGYMDQIMEGFSHNKKKIESLESRLNAMSTDMNANNPLPQNKFLNILMPANMKLSGSVKLPEQGMTMDIKKELDAFKKNEESRQNDLLKLRESISSFDKRMNKISCDLDTSKKMIDDISRKITAAGYEKETDDIGALRKQINEMTLRIADVDKRLKAGKFDDDGERHKDDIDIDRRIIDVSKAIKASLKSEIDAEINALRQTQPRCTDSKTADILPKKDAEKMNADILEVRTNIEKIKTALHGL